MTASIGIDFGSRTTKIVHLKNGSVSSRRVFATQPESWALVKVDLEKHPGIPAVATGYGRHLLGRNLKLRHVTEIQACARGAVHLFPACRTLLDVGGQDCKRISLDERGQVLSFEMNDRCAAGTGRFLEHMAQTFHMPLEGFVEAACLADRAVTINSMCTVFAESEVVSLITSGYPKEEIIRGLHVSIGKRLEAMMIRADLIPEVLFVGGGALNDCLHDQLELRLKTKILRPESPLTVAALGAALIAASR